MQADLRLYKRPDDDFMRLLAEVGAEAGVARARIQRIEHSEDATSY